MHATAAINLFGAGAFNVHARDLKGASLRVPPVSPPLVVLLSGDSTGHPVAIERPTTRTPPMSKDLQWTPVAQRPSTPCFAMAICSVLGCFSAPLEDPDMDQDFMAEQFRSFLPGYVRGLKDIDPGSELANLMRQGASLTRTGDFPEHTVRFSICTQNGDTKFVRSWRFDQSVDPRPITVVKRGAATPLAGESLPPPANPIEPTDPTLIVTPSEQADPSPKSE